MFTAIEGKSSSEDAQREFIRKFCKNAKSIQNGKQQIFLHDYIGIYFLEYLYGHRFGNIFGYNFDLKRTRFSRNKRDKIVEINPPHEGRNERCQGVFAIDDDGKRWILHKGQMSIVGKMIKAELFASATVLEPVEVSFSDGSKQYAYSVACIDDSAPHVQIAVSHYIRECSHVRSHYEDGPDWADRERNLEKIERECPERTGTYAIPAQNEKLVEKIHADVWRALTDILDKIPVKRSNGRVGRLGPDLYTKTEKPILFEIKTNNTMSDIHKAVGQLLIYDIALGGNLKKYAVFPREIDTQTSEILRNLEIHTMVYEIKSNNNIAFDIDEIKRIVS